VSGEGEWWRCKFHGRGVSVPDGELHIYIDTRGGTVQPIVLSPYYERDLTPKDRLSLSVRHELSRYELPNEQVQQAAGQLLTADNIETVGIVAYEHTFSSNMLADLRGMVRDNANDFNSNAELNSHRNPATQPLPRRVFQRRLHHHPRTT
jgi:hypothetical protein